MKTIRTRLAAIAILLCNLTASAADFSIGGIFYNIISDTELTVEVTYHGNFSDNYKGSVTIPSAITYGGKVYRVKSIGMYAFYSCPNLTSVVIPDGVESIGERAFDYSRNLTSITIPASVTEIGYDAFYNTAWLDKQPNGVVYAGKVLYDYKGTMPRNTSIEIKEGTASIAQGAFSRCSTLVSITIPESVISIGGSAFYDCSSLYEIAIPDGVTEVGYDAFEGSGWYKNQPDGVVYAGKVLYDYKGTMPENTSIEVKKGTTSIAKCAFSGCSNLTSIILPDGVTSIGEYAFDGCGSLTSITIPESVTKIGEGAFSSCSNLTSITIPQGVTKIEDSTFEGCSSLTSITIPEGVTKIGNSVFYDCYNLASISMPESVTEIASGTFWNTIWYDNLGDGVIYINNVLYEYRGAMPYNTSIEVREGTVSISSCAFFYNLNNQYSLKSVTIPASVTKIGSQAFDGCRGLTAINFAEGSKLTSIEHSAFSDCSSLTSIHLPKSVIKIDDSVLSGCSSLTDVIVPEDMTVMPACMFFKCSSLKTFDIPKGVACIGDRAFEGCNKLSTITIPSGVTKIRERVFKDCSSLTTITLPESVNSIGDNVFENCSGLTSILCRSWAPPVCGSDVFSGVDTSIPVYVPSVYSYQSADGWSAFTNIHRFLGLGTCGDDLTWHLTDEGELVILGTGAMTDFSSNYDIPWYDNKTSITKLIIDEGVTAIGARAFRDCGNLATIICKAKTPPTCYMNTFTGVSKNIPLHVPEASITTYQSAETWKNFTMIKPLIVASGICGENLAWYLTDGGELVISGTGAMSDFTSYSNKAPWDEFCETIVKVTINEGVTSIGDNAFEGCNNMVSVVIPGSISEIGQSAFSLGYDDVLTSVYISNLEAWCKISYNYHGDNPMMPAEKMYLNGEEITELVIPEGLTSICPLAFEGADGITSVTIPNSVTEIGALAFAECVSLTDINIPEKVTRIQPATFAACVSLTEFTIPDNVSEIGNQAFVACANLATVTIPKNVNLIRGQAFAACNNLSDVYCYAENLPTMESDVFYDVDIDEITLHVPAKAVEAYKASAPWCDFYDVVPIEPLVADVVVTDPYSEDIFVIEEDKENVNITYIRNFEDTNWQSLYVPFEIPYDTIEDDFVVAYISDVHQFDDDNNGTIDRAQVEAVKMGGGVLKANYPYLIRAKEVGEKVITLPNTTLYATEENSIDCSSVFNTYTFKGTYSKMSASELPKEEGYYVLTDGSWGGLFAGASLGAFRMYMKIDSRDASAAIADRIVEMRVVGDDELTGVEDLEETTKSQQSTVICDLYGRRIADVEKLKGGIYIINGKKVLK